MVITFFPQLHWQATGTRFHLFVADCRWKGNETAKWQTVVFQCICMMQHEQNQHGHTNHGIGMAIVNFGAARLIIYMFARWFSWHGRYVGQSFVMLQTEVRVMHCERPHGAIGQHNGDPGGQARWNEKSFADGRDVAFNCRWNLMQHFVSI